MGLPGVLWPGGCTYRDISHLSVPLLQQDAPYGSRLTPCSLDSKLSPPQLWRGFLTPE